MSVLLDQATSSTACEPGDRAHRRAASPASAAHRAGGDRRARRTRHAHGGGHAQRAAAAGAGARPSRSPSTSRPPRRPTAATRATSRRRSPGVVTLAVAEGDEVDAGPDRRDHRGDEDGGVDHRAARRAGRSGLAINAVQQVEGGDLLLVLDSRAPAILRGPPQALARRRGSVRPGAMPRADRGRSGGRAAAGRAAAGTRPTSDRVREALFSALAATGPRRGAGARPVRRLGRARVGGAVPGRGARAVRRVGPARRRGAAAQRRGARRCPGPRCGRRPAAAVLAGAGRPGLRRRPRRPALRTPDAEVAGWLARGARARVAAPRTRWSSSSGDRAGASRGRRRCRACGSGGTATRCYCYGRGAREPDRPAPAG